MTAATATIGQAARAQTAPAGLRLQLLGGFSAWVDDAQVAECEWKRRKVSRLVKLLALAPDHRLHRDQVIGLLWPALEARAAAQNLHHTLYRARRALEPTLERRGEPRFLRLHDDLVALAPSGELEIDLARFERAARRAFASPGDIALQREAVDRYGGELLPSDRFEDWAIDRRDAAQTSNATAAISMRRTTRSGASSRPSRCTRTRRPGSSISTGSPGGGTSRWPSTSASATCCATGSTRIRCRRRRRSMSG
jgi:two-component SAPR family response regulator